MNISYNRELECPLFSSDIEAIEPENSTLNTGDNKDASGKESQAKRKRRRIPVIQSELGQPHPFYECIAPLRCLLLRDSEPQKWAAIQQMMDHIEVSRKIIIQYSIKVTSTHLYYQFSYTRSLSNDDFKYYI